jgi:2-(1,2-epoxy-1,2-dihydrophenyl)acetyl-CoA isomerase
MSNLVLSRVDGSVAVLTLNRPERHNSLTPELLSDFLAVLETWQNRLDLGAMVVQANGRSFSTGGDVRAFSEHRADIALYSNQVVGLLNRVILALIDFPVPIVAAIHGIVTGGSIGLVLASDIVLAAPAATFAPYYTTVGFSPDGGWTALLPSLIGAKRAAEALLIDQTITADQAVAWGLVNWIVPADRIREEARAIAASIARHSPGSVQRTKRLLWGDRNLIAARLEDERKKFVEQIESAEAQDGMTAFLQRRAR